MLRINDFPEASAHSPARQETSTPLQMLFALNSSFLQQQADALARRVADAGATEERVRRAYALTYQRTPTERELKLATVSSDVLTVPAVLEAPTVRTQGALPGHRIPPYCSCPLAFFPRFPAAATTTMP